jgi:hypothetical protein
MEFFRPDNTERYKEYLHCLAENIQNVYIDTIVLLVSDDSDCPLISNKMIHRQLDKRPTYDDIFKICNEEYVDQVCIISNSDIIFDDTLKHITDKNILNKFVALNRWDLNGDGSLSKFRHNIGDSQDCWIFKSPVDIPGADFTMGKLGCDNRIVYLAHESGMGVINPSEQIITQHFHNTNFRTTSADSQESVFGMHLIVPAIPTMESRQSLVKRNWPKR